MNERIPFRHRLVEDCLHPRGDRIPRKLSCALKPVLPQHSRDTLALDQTLDGPYNFVRVGWIDIDRGLSGDLRERRYIRSDDRSSASHGLQNWNSESLVKRRK